MLMRRLLFNLKEHNRHRIYVNPHLLPALRRRLSINDNNQCQMISRIRALFMLGWRRNSMSTR